MDIYFIRHGQTDGNVARRHQHPDIDLNEMGKLQVARTAKLVKRLRPTHLITSTSKRAVETAQAIGLATDLIPETYPAFEELKRPTFLIGKRFHDSDSLKYIWGWFFGVKAAPMHDGESYADFLGRIIQAREIIRQLPENSRVAVVSHAVFINFFLEHMNRPERMGLTRATRRFIKLFTLKNASVTHVRYHDGRFIIVDRF
jgi:alpha-ribazole phosphatase